MAKKIKDDNGNIYVPKKPFYKRVWFWLLIIILIFIAFIVTSIKNNSNNGSLISTITTNSQINPKNFDKIQLSESTGPSRDEVEKMFGKKPSLISTRKIHENQAEMAVWKGTASRSVITIDFINGHAISKSISELSNSKKITSEQFNSIKDGMSKTDVKKSLGKPYKRTYSSVGDPSVEMWQYNGKGNLDSNLIITFTHNCVSGKSQAE